MPNESNLKANDFKHLPVLANSVVESINNLPAELLNGGLIIDATIGRGGHTALVLAEHPALNVIGVDQDPNARAAATQYLSHFGNRVKIESLNFADFTPPKKAAAVIADLGVSSPQLDVASRGFSFRLDGPLDMRMNPEQGVTAAELIEKLSEEELANTIYKFGEEKLSRKIARKIKKDLSLLGPYNGTCALAYTIAGCYPPKARYGRIHPATRTFQALRIAVNKELDVLDKLLSRAPEWLHPGGVLGIITFHSLEDRRVKIAFKNDERLERINRKPVIANLEEISANPRSRSAKFRSAARK